MILRAKVVLPLSRPAIKNGAVFIAGGRVEAVGPWRELSRLAGIGKVVDLGESILLPGLINAHCHLDYSHMAGQFAPPKIFTDWLKQITATKAGWSLADYSASWQAGAEMLVRTGTTTVADIEAVPTLLPAVWHSTPLRVFSFLEMIGITQRRSPQALLEESVQKIAGLKHPRSRAGLSPHAPYSTLPALLRLSGKAARRRNWLVCTHVAESALEFLMFNQATGGMFDWLQRSGRDMSDCGNTTPVKHLERCGLLRPNLLAAHVNYLGREDATLLARRGVSVVHCPRGHAYFRHDALPLRRLLRAGVNICLGTDSLASICQERRQTVELNMFEEMRAVAAKEPSLSPRTLLRWSTINGARALGKQRRLGEISPGAAADLIAIPLSGGKDVYETVLRHPGNVTASLIGGRWAVAPSDAKKPAGARQRKSSRQP